MCRRKRFANIDFPFLGYVGAKCDVEHWSAKIEVNGHDTVKQDKSPGVYVVTDRDTWLQSENLPMTKQTLRGPGGKLLPVIKARLGHRNMVPVQKANITVRICVDLNHLNKSVQREIHPISLVDESLAKLGNSKVFSKLDANNGVGSFCG